MPRLSVCPAINAISLAIPARLIHADVYTTTGIELMTILGPVAGARSIVFSPRDEMLFVGYVGGQMAAFEASRSVESPKSPSAD